jgi:hypothetical protein
VALRSALDAAEPRFIRILSSTRAKQVDTLTFRAIEQAIANGVLSLDILERWRQDYARIVTQHLDPLLTQIAQLAGPGLEGNQPLRAALLRQEMNLANNLTNQQVKAIRALVYRGYAKGWSETTIAQYLRPIIGLSAPQAAAVERYQAGLIANGVRLSTAQRQAQQYASRLWRQRALTIARTELASAYAVGEEAFIRHQQAHGRLGAIRRVWRTAGDERVCDTCGPLDGTVVQFIPPLHPLCRCSVEYEQVQQRVLRPVS